MTFVSRRKPFTRNRRAVQMSGHARAQVPLRRAAKRGGSRRVRLRSLPERARPRFRAVAVVPRRSLPPRGASEQASAAGERPGAEPRSQRAWCRVPLPGGGDERRDAWSCGLRSRWSCFRERCRKFRSCEVRRQGAFHRGPSPGGASGQEPLRFAHLAALMLAGRSVIAAGFALPRDAGRRPVASSPGGGRKTGVPSPFSTRAGWAGTTPRPAGTR